MNDRYVLVTGGNSGIGAAISRAFLNLGCQVISMSQKAAEPMGGIQHIEADLSNATETREIALDVARRFPITTVIHNAGAMREKPVESVTLEDLEALSHLHLAAPLSLVQANLPTMKQQGFGRIVLISSRAILGLANRTAYAASKAGMLGLARTWALELGVHGVTANVVAPGPIEGTSMFHDVIPRDSPQLPRIIDGVPVKRLGRPEDVARAVLFFADPAAGFVTGQTLFVCGGTSIGSIVY